MRAHTASRSLVRRALLALFVAASVSGALASRAEACGMEMFYRAPRPDPAVLLVQAWRHLDEGRNVSALFKAQSVLDSGRGTKAQRAEALSIVGWVRWLRGNHVGAIEAMKEGRTLDKEPLDFVLLMLASDEDQRAVHEALGA